MTNKEKAIELVGGNWMVFNKEYSAAMQMAEWKDHQYEEIIKEEYNTAYESGFSAGERTAEERFHDFPSLEEIQTKANELINEKVKHLEDIYGMSIEDIDAREALGEWYDSMIELARWIEY